MPVRGKPTPKALDGIPKPRRKKDDVHAEFAEHAQLLRWCHERTLKELKALRKAFDAARKLQTPTTNTHDPRYD
jgi:hypothetical protein